MGPEEVPKKRTFSLGRKKKEDPESPKFPAVCVQEDSRLGRSTCKSIGGSKVSNERCTGSALFTDIGTIFHLFSRRVPSVGSGCGTQAICCRWREPGWYHIKEASYGIGWEQMRLGVGHDFAKYTDFAQLT